MKKTVFVLLFVCILLSSFTSALAEERAVIVRINGEPIVTPVPARIVNGRTVLPMRAIFERLGAVVTWVGEDRIIFATKDDTLMVMQIDNYNVSVQKTNTQEKKMVPLDVAPFIDNGHTLVPVRAVAETLNAKVEWDNVNYIVDIYK